MKNSSHQVAKVLELQLQFLGIDWFNLLAVQGPPMSLLQHPDKQLRKRKTELREHLPQDTQ